MPDIFEKVDRELHLFSQFQTPGRKGDRGMNYSKLKASPQSTSHNYLSRNPEAAAHYLSEKRSQSIRPSRVRNDPSFLTQRSPRFGGSHFGDDLIS